MKTTINFENFSEQKREEYAEAWKDVGGTIADADSGSPWCCPWFWGTKVIELELPENYTVKDVAAAMLEAYPEAQNSRTTLEKLSYDNAFYLNDQERYYLQYHGDEEHDLVDGHYPDDFGELVEDEDIEQVLTCVVCNIILLDAELMQMCDQYDAIQLTSIIQDVAEERCVTREAIVEALEIS